MCVVQTVNRLITKTSLVVLMDRESFMGLCWCPGAWTRPPAPPVKGEPRPGRKAYMLHVLPGQERLWFVFSLSGVCPSGFARIPLPNHFLCDGHMHMPNCMVLFELA